jgi:hypothetical protein
MMRSASFIVFFPLKQVKSYFLQEGPKSLYKVSNPTPLMMVISQFIIQVSTLKQLQNFDM